MDLMDTINQLKRIKRTGLLDTVKGRREPDGSTPPVAAAELRQRLLEVKGIGIPFEVIEGEGGKKGDLVARWRIREATWWSYFRDADTGSVTDLKLVLDEDSHEVRVKDKLTLVRWNGNVPKVGGFSTKPAKVTAATGRSVVEGDDPLNEGRRRWYSLDTNELKELVGELITRSGWTYRQVYRGKTLQEG
jgi:hypothetical protein